MVHTTMFTYFATALLYNEYISVGDGFSRFKDRCITSNEIYFIYTGIYRRHETCLKNKSGIKGKDAYHFTAN